MTPLNYDTQRHRGTENDFSKRLCASVPRPSTTARGALSYVEGRCVVLGGRRIATLVVLVFLVAKPVAADEIRVMTSGAFTEAYQQLVQQFQKTTHHTVVTTFGASMGGASDSIPVRLGRGEPVDVVIIIDKRLGRGA